MPFIRLLPLLFFLLFAAPVAAASAPSLEGLWDVTGWEPGGAASGEPTYTGQVALSKRGEGYFFEGVLDGGEYFGVGLFDPKSATLSLVFQGPSGEDSGLTVLRLEGGKLEGRWIYLADDEGLTGREVWARAAK